MHRCRQRFRSDDLDVAADRFGRDAAAVGDPDLQVRVAGNRGAGQPAHALAAAVDGDVAGHGLGLDPAVQAAAQVDAAADGLRFDVGGVQGQLQVAADAFDVGLARRAGDGDVAADAVDLQAAAGGADHADLHGDAIEVEAGQRRHVDHQVGRLAAVVAHARVADDDFELIAVAAELKGVDAAPEAAADMHFGLVPDAHLDAALEVRDLDLRSEEHTSELQSLMRISYSVFCLKKKIIYHHTH